MGTGNYGGVGEYNGDGWDGGRGFGGRGRSFRGRGRGYGAGGYYDYGDSDAPHAQGRGKFVLWNRVRSMLYLFTASLLLNSEK